MFNPVGHICSILKGLFSRTRNQLITASREFPMESAEETMREHHLPSAMDEVLLFSGKLNPGLLGISQAE